MKLTRLWLAGVILIPALALGACDSEKDPEPSDSAGTPSVAQTAEPVSGDEASTAVEALRKFVQAVPGIDTFSGLGATEAKGARQVYDFDVDKTANSFAGTLTVQEGEAEQRAELIRTSQTTWLKASDDYWRSQGFDADSVKRSHSKYVVFDQQTGETIAKQYNLGAVFASLEKVKAENAKVEGVVDLDGVEAYRYNYKFGSQSMIIDLTESGDRVRLISKAQGSVSTFVMSEFGKKVDIQIPDPDEVMQPKE